MNRANKEVFVSSLSIIIISLSLSLSLSCVRLCVCSWMDGWMRALRLEQEVENAAGGGSPKDLFKMKKFANVGPKVSSHRRPSAPPSPSKGAGSPLPQEQQGRPGASALSRDGGGAGSDAGAAQEEWQ